MPAAGSWFVTPHAVRQYMQLHLAPDTYAAALEDLVRYSETARFIRVHESGALILRGPRPHRLRFVVTAADAPGRLPALVTVIRDPMFRPREQGEEYGRGKARGSARGDGHRDSGAT